MSKFLTVADVARICHEANRAYCLALGDDSQQPWDITPANIQHSAIDGVKFHLANPEAGDSASHSNWLEFKAKDGWKYGPAKDTKKKEHPCYVPFNELPVEQQVKDSLFRSVVNALRPFVMD